MIDAIIQYYQWFLEALPMFAIYLVAIFFHELGHYYSAKKQGIYKGWGILPNPHIKLTQFAPRWSYAIGFLFSLAAVPLWLLSFGLGTLWVFLIMIAAAAGADFFVIIFYGRLKKKK